MSSPGGTREATERVTRGLDDLAPTDALREAGQQLLGLLVQRAAQVASDRVVDLTNRLGEAAREDGPGLSALLPQRPSPSEGEGRHGIRERLGAGLRGLAQKVKGLFGGGGGAKKLKVTNIVEETDIGLPLRVTYNLWTQFEEFPSFMKKVKTVEQADDEKVNWKARVFWSVRSWDATIVEQIPDSHIVWRSTGQKGHVNGAVTFTALGPNLTRVLVVLEYYPQGLHERTGNLWRAQGRRARLELKHFRRHAMANALVNGEEIEGWRGEIRDSEVVRTHEEALQGEHAGAEEAEGPEAAEEPAETGEDATREREGEAARDYASEEDEREPDEVEEYEEGEDYETPADYDEDFEQDADQEQEPEDERGEDTELDEADAEPVGGRRRRAMAGRLRRGR